MKKNLLDPLDTLREDILSFGADLVGFADITGLPSEKRHNLPYGISVAIAVDPQTASRALNGPTKAYFDNYEALNARLDAIGKQVESRLTTYGYASLALTTDLVKAQRKLADPTSEAAKAPMPHKTVAARAGLGWIGKNTLLITEAYGSAVRLTSILTDAPVPAANPTYPSLCGDCSVCAEACPGSVIKGHAWTPETDRDALLDFFACRIIAVERGRDLGITYASCGICMAICPYTQEYLRSADII